MNNIIPFRRNSQAFEDALQVVKNMPKDIPANDDLWVIDRARATGCALALGGCLLFWLIFAPLAYRGIAALIHQATHN